MVQLSSRFRFDLKSLEFGRGGKPSAQDHFDRRFALQHSVLCTVDDSHSTTSNFLKQFVVAAHQANCRRSVLGTATRDVSLIVFKCGMVARQRLSPPVECLLINLFGILSLHGPAGDREQLSSPEGG